MSPEHQQANSENTSSEIAFVQQALAAADRSERSSRIIVGVLTIPAIVAFIWMHLHMFPPETLGDFCIHSFASTSFSWSSCSQSPCTFVRSEQEYPHHPPDPR
jgi:hypothetical protein